MPRPSKELDLDAVADIVDDLHVPNTTNIAEAYSDRVEDVSWSLVDKRLKDSDRFTHSKPAASITVWAEVDDSAG